MRALALLYQDDARARAAKDEYLFGPDLLVAPVIDEGMQRTVYLPQGEWVDYWTGAAVAGGKVVVADAPLETIPVWARAGAVLAKDSRGRDDAGAREGERGFVGEDAGRAASV